MKTGEVLVGYSNTNDIEYADEYTDRTDAQYNAQKASAKDRAVFNKIKDHYDLGTDEVEYREITEEVTVTGIQPVDYLATDLNGMHLAAVYLGTDGLRHTMNGGIVYDEGAYQTVADEKVFYPGVTSIDPVEGTYIYVSEDGEEVLYTEDISSGSLVYKDQDGNILVDEMVIAALEPYCSITDLSGKEVFGLRAALRFLHRRIGFLCWSMTCGWTFMKKHR